MRRRLYVLGSFLDRTTIGVNGPVRQRAGAEVHVSGYTVTICVRGGSGLRVVWA